MKVSSRSHQAPNRRRLPQTDSKPDSANRPDSVSLSGNSGREPIPGSYIVRADTAKFQSLQEIVPNLRIEKMLGSAGDTTYLLVNHSTKNADGLSADGDVITEVHQNFRYNGNIYDEVMPSNVEETYPRHLDIIGARKAWEVTEGDPKQVSAVTDTGVDIHHPELVKSFWKNSDEVAGDGRDNDNNGYVDDVNGYDITDDDGDPNDTGSSHHTHVHGIMHAKHDGSGVTGVAPGSQGMALRIAGGKRGYSTAVVAEAYLYAMNNGAKTINTSFNIDRFVGDKAMESTYRSLADGDVLVFNSAGNAGRRDPRRSAFEDVVLVASTEASRDNPDRKSSFSNYGSAIDVAAPGSNILSTLPNGRQGTMSGTSMASPVAAGVDMLVRSAHPDWSRAQRWAQISGTADNIDSSNPGNEGLFGGGRVNAERALTEKLAPPTLRAGEVKNDKLTVRFGKVLDPESANQRDAWKVLDSEGLTVMTGAPKEVRLLTNELKFDVSGLQPGEYKLVASADHLKDPFGQALDGDGDGEGGDNFVSEFRLS